MTTPLGAQRAMATVALAVAAGAAVSPGGLLRAFGVPPDQATGAALLGWRLFATRTFYLGGRALAGDPGAVAMFGPVQVLDQAVFWHAFATRSVPRRTSTLAVATSAVIIWLDLVRRRGSGPHGGRH